MKINQWFRIRIKSEETVVRIRKLIKDASKVDKNLKVFGSDKHKYKLNECVSGRDIDDFEKKYNRTLPNDFKEFVTKIGNGGVGPYYGIYPINFEKDCDEYKYASRPCRLFPHMKKEDWQEVIREYNNMADDTTDEEYDRLYNEVWQGMITIGTQGCTYDMMLVITGDYKGRVVYVDRNMDENIPFFVHEDNFLQWYERWLVEIINGYDITWFGFKMGGDEKVITDKLKSCAKIDEKLTIVGSILKFKSISNDTKNTLYDAYKEEKDSKIRQSIISVLIKYKDVRSKELLKDALLGESKNEAVKSIFYYDKDSFNFWYKDVLKACAKLNSEGLRFAFYILTKCSDFNPLDIVQYFKHKDDEVKKSVTYEFGKLKNKAMFIKEFIIVLKDDNPYVVHTAIQATYDIKDDRLVPIYKDILKKYYDNDKYYICTNLKHAFQTHGISYVEMVKEIKNKYKKVNQ